VLVVVVLVSQLAHTQIDPEQQTVEQVTFSCRSPLATKYRVKEKSTAILSRFTQKSKRESEVSRVMMRGVSVLLG
jgi:hypothetical protein